MSTFVTPDRILAADERGIFRGRFLYGGTPPEPQKLVLNKDIEYCSKFTPISEELLVDQKTRGLKNVVIWLDVKASGRRPRMTEEQNKLAKKPVVIDNSQCQFKPHIAVAQTGQPVVLKNNDKIAHAMLMLLFANDPLSIVVPANSKEGETRTFPKPEPLPVSITCPIHSWMKSYLVMTDHPYVAVTGTDGTFEMPALPPGKWTFRAWHEAAGYIDVVQRIPSSGGPIPQEPKTEWTKGRFEFTIQAGKNSLGTAVVPADQFKVN